MSLINDALRRASSAARGASAPPPVPVAAHIEPPAPPRPAAASAFPAPPPLAFAEDSSSPGLGVEELSAPRTNQVQLILAVVLVLAVGVAAAMNFQKKNNQEKQTDVSANEGHKAILSHVSAIPAAAKTLAAVSNRAITATAPAPIAVAAAPPVVAVPPAAPSSPPNFPPLRLQSIFYRPANPSVMINGRTLYMDDQIQGVTIADIQPSCVTLVLSGQTNVLTLR